MTKLSLTYYGFNYVDYYNGEYTTGDGTNDGSDHLADLANVAATGADSIAETPDYGIDLADSTVYAGGSTTDTTADQTAAITTATSDKLSSFVRPSIDFLYPQKSVTYTNPQNYYVPNSYTYGQYTYAQNNVPTGVTAATLLPSPQAVIDDGDYDNYRGGIAPTDIGSISKLFGSPTTAGSYDYLMVNEAKLAAADGATLFSIGTELDSLIDDTGATSYWLALIADIRSAAPSLKLTYCSNWATATSVPTAIWNKLDYVGIDGYVPLSNVVPDSQNDNNPSLATLTAGWNTVSNVVVADSNGTTVSQFTGGKTAIDFFDTLAEQSITGKFMFTEFGYQNDTGAANDPTGTNATGVLDPTLQTALYQAFFNAWGGAQATAATNGGKVDGIPFALAGAYIWNYDPDPTTSTPGTGNYDNWTLNPNAVAVFTASVSSPNPIVVAQTNIAGVAGYMGSPRTASGTAGTSGTGALAGDSDPGGTALSIVGTISTSAGVTGSVGTQFNTGHGLLTLSANGAYQYFTSANGPTGSPTVDTITYVVMDTLGYTSYETLTITGYRDPVAVNESFATPVSAGGTITGTAGTTGTGALKGDSDPDGAAIQVNAYFTPLLNVTLPAIGSPIAGTYGTFTVNADGSFSYTANSAASLKSAFAAAGTSNLTDSVTYFVGGPASTYAAPVGLGVTITNPGVSSSYSYIGASGSNWQTAADWQNLTAGTNPSTTVPTANDSASITGGATTALQVNGNGTTGSLAVSQTVTLNGTFSVGALTVGTAATAGTLTTTDPVLATSVTVTNGTLTASGLGSISASGAVTLGGAGATNANDQQSLMAVSQGYLLLGSLTMTTTAGLYEPAYVGTDANSAIEIGTGGGSVKGSIVVDSGATLSGTGTVGSAVIDNGTVSAQGGLLYLGGALSGSGTLQIGSGSSVTATSVNVKTVAFSGTGDTLTFGSSATNATVTGFAAGDTLALVGTSGVSVKGNVVSFGSTSYTFSGLPAGQALTATTSGTATQITLSTAKAVAEDFDGDGKSDLLLQNTNGAIVVETQANLAVKGGYYVGNAGSSWHVVGSGDFNGDGQPDLLLQNDNSAIVEFTMNGTVVAAGNSFGTPGAGWHVRGIGDFNGDGKADMVLQNDNGAIVIEDTNGTAVTSGTYVGNPGAGWTVEGVADLNGDGTPDLVLQNTNGAIVDFLMSGNTIASGNYLGNPGTGWSVVGTGDYNADGKADVLVHNDGGADVVLETNGTAATGAVSLGNPGASYTDVVGGVDLNGDGLTDFLLENTSGSIVGFTINASAQPTAGALITAPGPGWTAIGNDPMQFIDGSTSASGATLTGTVGVDEFNFTSFMAGLHTISGFDAAQDIVALGASAFSSYAAVQANEAAYQGGTFIALTPGSTGAGLVIQGVTPGQLSASNFVFR